MRYAVTLSSVLVILAFAFLSSLLSADHPFANLEGKTKSRWSGWGVNNRDKAKVFNAERKRLGKAFQRELLKYVAEDIQRHYWCASFLTANSYIGDNAAMPKLALLLLEQGITLCKADLSQDGNKGHLVSFSANAAVLCQQLGLNVQAKHHRGTTERLIEQAPDLVGAWPCMTKDERKVFDSIPYKAKKKTESGRGE